MVIKQRAIRSVEFLKMTAIGGVFFLLPLIIIGTFLAKFVQFSVATARVLENVMPLKGFGGFAMVLVVGIGAIVALCFISGLLAKRSIARRFTEKIEKQLQIAFPRYAIVKDRLSGNIGGEIHRSELKTVLVQGHDGYYRLGLEVERGTSGWATIYFPSSPDPWAGQVAIVPEQQLQPLSVDFITAMTTLEKLGRDLQLVTKCELPQKVVELRNLG